MTLNAPLSLTSRLVTAPASMLTATRTGSIATWVTQLWVMPFHSSPWREPMRHSTFGMRHSTLLSVSAVTDVVTVTSVAHHVASARRD